MTLPNTARARVKTILSKSGNDQFFDMKNFDETIRAHMRTQLHIQDASGAEDRARIEQALVAASTEFGIVDTTVTSRVPDTIRCYSERIGHGFAICARVVGNLIIVDFYAGKEPSPRFPAVEQRLTSELRHIFGERIIIPKASDYIATQSCLPVSDSAREFHRKHFRHETPAA